MGNSPGVIGRLLEEISWEGSTGPYRNGGRGRENVLSAEVLQALDFLPRRAFFGGVIGEAIGADSDTLRLLAGEIEHASLSLLPGNSVIPKREGSDGNWLAVQPDAILESPGVYCLIEAKGFKAGGFQREQLARELITTIQDARGKRPLLLLILPDGPPVLVRRHGRQSVREAVLEGLPSVLERIGESQERSEEFSSQIESVIAYVTWDDVRRIVERASEEFQSSDSSFAGTVSRLCGAIAASVAWHANP